MFARTSGWFRRGSLIAGILALALSYLLMISTEILVAQTAEVQSRSITMGSSEEDAETDYTIQFTIPAGSTVGAVRIEFCDNDPLPFTTCTFNAVGDDIPQVDANAGSIATESGSDAFAFTGAVTNCTNPTLTAPSVGHRHLDIICNGGTEAFGGATVFSGTIDNIDNPSNATDSPANPNNTFYARIYVYDTTTPPAIVNPIAQTNVAHLGGIALSTAEQLTITARVQEILEFCVGTALDGAVTTCGDMTGNAVDMGVLDFGSVTRSTVSTGDQGSVMVRTNAASGVIIDYFAEQATSGTNHLGALRVTGATCTADGTPSTSEIDQCINSVGTTQTPIVAGTEEFGLCIFNVHTPGSTTNLSPDAEYDDVANTCNNTLGFAFDETGTVDRLADSTTVVHDEMLELEFGGTSAITTPTGLYNVTLTFIGTATF